MTKHHFVFLLSILTGTLLTTGLIICINLLTYSRTQPAIERPLLALNLMSWDTPEKTTKTPKVVTSKPIKKQVQEKTVPKKKLQTPQKSELNTHVKTAVKPKPIIKPIQETITQKTVVPSEKTATVTKDVLPTPVPIFKLTLSPRFLHRQEPVFPETMRVEGISGVVKLEALIDKRGRVRQVNIIKSAGKYFDAAAKHAISASSFYPAKIGNQPVAVLLRLPVRFGLL